MDNIKKEQPFWNKCARGQNYNINKKMKGTKQ